MATQVTLFSIGLAIPPESPPESGKIATEQPGMFV